MKKYDRFTLLMLIISACTAVAAVGGRIFLTLTALDRHGVYEHGNILPTLYHIFLAAILAALGIVCIIKGKKNKSDTLIPATSFTIFFSCSSAFLLCVALFYSFYNMSTSGDSLAVIDVLELIASVPTVIFFFLVALQKGKRSTALAMTSIFPSVWCAICVMRIYFNSTVLMNSPDKILSEFALVLSMLFFLMEARNQISISLKGFYTAAALTAPILLLSASIPNLIYPDILETGDVYSTIHYITYISVALFMYARLAAKASVHEEAAEVPIPDSLSN